MSDHVSSAGTAPTASSPASGKPPSVPGRPPGKVRGRLAVGAFFNGLGLVVVVYVSGLLSLLGDYRIELYVLGGIIFGAFLFPLLGKLLAARVRHALVPALVLATAVVAALTFVNSVDLTLSDADLTVRAIACTVFGLPAAVVALPPSSPGVSRRRALARPLWLGSGPILMGVAYSLIYAGLGFAGFPYLVVLTELFAAVLLALLFVVGVRRSSQAGVDLGSTAAPSGPGRSNPDLPGASEERATTAPARLPTRSRRAPALALVHAPRVLVMVLSLVVLLLLSSNSSVLLTTAQADAARASSRGALGVSSASTATPIQHVVTIMMENRGFDSLFGVYPAVGGHVDVGKYGAAGVTVPDNLENSSAHYACTGTPPSCGPTGLTITPNGTFSNENPLEGYSPYHIDWNGGKMDGWLSSGGSGSAGLATYTATQMAPEWVLAQEYALGDNYYASMLSETTPNRLYALAGFSPVINDYGPPPYVPYDQTIFGELDQNGVSWGYYLDQPSQGIGTLGLISGMSVGSPGVDTWSQFQQELSQGSLPSVSWLLPTDGGVSGMYDEGPGGNVLQGEMWLLYWLQQIEQSPEWNSTAIVLTYDEGGGMYDHVAPPTLDGELLGQRIPMIVISPYAKEDYVSHTMMNHASWLAFIDYNWKLPSLNGFVADSNLPLDMFDFQNGPRAPFPLTASQGFPVPSAIPFALPTSPDLAPLFPQPFQLPPGGLPYAHTGESATTLRSLGGPLFVEQSSGMTPWYLTDPFLAAVFVVEVLLWTLHPRTVALGRARKRARRASPA